MDASYLAPRNLGPDEEATVELNTFLPERLKEILEKNFPSSALTRDNPLLLSPDTFSASTPNFLFSLGRLAKYESASPLIKEILLLLYGTPENFISATGHPLEPYLFALDVNLDSDSTVRAIGSAMGLYVDVDPNYFAFELLLDKLVSCIDVLETKRINDVKYSGRPKIGDIISMQREEFRKWVEREGHLLPKRETPFENLYQDRLNFFRYTTMSDEERYAVENDLPSVYDTTRIAGEEPLSSSIIERVYYREGI